MLECTQGLKEAPGVVRDCSIDQEMKMVMKGRLSGWKNITGGILHTHVMFLIYTNDMVGGTASFVSMLKMMLRSRGKEKMKRTVRCCRKTDI